MNETSDIRLMKAKARFHANGLPLDLNDANLIAYRRMQQGVDTPSRFWRTALKRARRLLYSGWVGGLPAGER